MFILFFAVERNGKSIDEQVCLILSLKIKNKNI